MISLHEGRERFGLDGIWRYMLEGDEPGESLGYPRPELDTEAWPEMELPTNWYRTEVGDFFGTIWFRRSFRVPAPFRGQRVFLRFGAVDYLADVWLNGTYLGHHEGMFNPFEFDVTERMDLEGENVVVVKDAAPRDDTEYVPVGNTDNPLSAPYRTHQARAISQIKGHMIDAMHRPGAMTSFRSDGNSGGIWDSVELIARPDVYVDHVRIFTKIGVRKDWLGDRMDKPDGTALVSVDVTVHNTTRDVAETELGLAIRPASFDDPETCERTRPVVLQPGRTTHSIAVTVPNARLWWTWDLGVPNLYTATVTLDGDAVEQRFGIKEVAPDPQTGRWHLNGRRIFLRGMRYISSLWMSEANERMWADDLTKMLEMEINAIRIGSHVERDGFYSLCDELGILVWQVFPLHYCVSDADDLIERATEMIKDMGLMLTNHACIGMWSVFKEPEVYLLPDKPNNVHRLCPALKQALGTVDPVRWIHIGDYREGVYNLMIGYCWDGDTRLDEIELPPHIVEFGAGSIPVRETLETIVPADKLWPPDWDTWEYHGFFYDLAFGFAKVEMKDTLDAFIEAYQDYEALVVKEQVEYLRQRKYRPIASMFHYYWSDPCPIMGSGLFDHFRRPYKVYEAMRNVYGRVLVSLERDVTPYVIGREKVYERGSTFAARIWITNDHPEPIENASVSWELASTDPGEVLDKGGATLTLAADSAEAIDRISWVIAEEARPGTYRVSMSVFGSDGATMSSNWTDFTVR
jgi:beta-mannosidase